MNSRRDFLQKLAGSAIAFSLLPGSSSAASPGQSPTGITQTFPAGDSTSDIPYTGPVLRVAIMGLGSHGILYESQISGCHQWDAFQSSSLEEQVQYPR